jgi:glutamine amidotransferase-like uncharacterized protein
LSQSDNLVSIDVPSLNKTISLYADSDNAFYFNCGEESASIATLSNSQVKKQIIAIKKVVNGFALLVGAQVECNADHINSIKSIDPKLVNLLKSQDKERTELIRVMLEELGKIHGNAFVLT